MRYTFLLFTAWLAGISNLWGLNLHTPSEKDTLLLIQRVSTQESTEYYNAKRGVRIFPKKDTFEYAVLARSLGLYLVGIVKDTMVIVTDNRKCFYNNSLQNIATRELKKRYKHKFKIDIGERNDPADYAILSNQTDTLIFGRFMNDDVFSLTAGSVEGKFCDADYLQAGAYCTDIATELGFVWDDKYHVKYIALLFADTAWDTWYSKYHIGYRPHIEKYPVAFPLLFYNCILLNLDYDDSEKAFVKHIRISACYGEEKLYRDYQLPTE